MDKPLTISSQKTELLEGWPGFDLDARVNLGRRAGRAATLTFTIKGGPVRAENTVVKGIQGDRLFAGVSTRNLPPGNYQLEGRLEAPNVPDQRIRVPFTILRGPWR